MKYTLISMVTAMALALTPAVYAETELFNSVSVSAETGGNSEGGSVRTGESKAKVFLKTVVNGEVVERIDERVESSGGDENIVIEKEFRSDDEQIQTNVDLQSEGAAEDGAEVNQVETESNTAENTAEKKQFFLAAFFEKFIHYVFAILS